MLQAKATLLLVSLLALGATGCGHRMSRRYRVVQVPVYVPTVVIYQGGNPRMDYERRAQEQAAREAAERDAAAREQAEAERRAQEQAAREAAAREAAEREAAAAREAARIEQEQAAAAERARAAEAARSRQGGTTIIILGPGSPPPQGAGRQAAPGVWVSGE